LKLVPDGSNLTAAWAAGAWWSDDGADWAPLINLPRDVAALAEALRLEHDANWSFDTVGFLLGRQGFAPLTGRRPNGKLVGSLSPAHGNLKPSES
jgi:hypothetical protein